MESTIDLVHALSVYLEPHKDRFKVLWGSSRVLLCDTKEGVYIENDKEHSAKHLYKVYTSFVRSSLAGF